MDNAEHRDTAQAIADSIVADGLADTVSRVADLVADGLRSQGIYPPGDELDALTEAVARIALAR